MGSATGQNHRQAGQIGLCADTLIVVSYNIVIAASVRRWASWFCLLFVLCTGAAVFIMRKMIQADWDAKMLDVVDAWDGSNLCCPVFGVFSSDKYFDELLDAMWRLNDHKVITVHGSEAGICLAHLAIRDCIYMKCQQTIDGYHHNTSTKFAFRYGETFSSARTMSQV